MWFLIGNGIAGATGGVDERLQIACILLTNAIKMFYRKRHTNDPTENLTRINALNRTRAEPTCKTKGAETWGLLMFLVETFAYYGEHISADIVDFTAVEYFAAARELVSMVEVMNAAERKMKRHKMDMMLYHWERFVNLPSTLKNSSSPSDMLSLTWSLVLNR